MSETPDTEEILPTWRHTPKVEVTQVPDGKGGTNTNIDIAWATEEYMHACLPEEDRTGLYWILEDVAELLVDPDDRAIGLSIQNAEVFIEKLKELAQEQKDGKHIEGNPRLSLNTWFL